MKATASSATDVPPGKMRGFKVLIVIALLLGFGLVDLTAWLGFQALSWVIDHIGRALDLPLGDAVRVLANLPTVISTITVWYDN